MSELSTIFPLFCTVQDCTHTANVQIILIIRKLEKLYSLYPRPGPRVSYGCVWIVMSYCKRDGEHCNLGKEGGS